MGRCIDNIEIVFAIREVVVDDYVVSSPPYISAEPEVGQYQCCLSSPHQLYTSSMTFRKRGMDQSHQAYLLIAVVSNVFIEYLGVWFLGIASAQQYVVRLPVSFQPLSLSRTHVLIGTPQ